MKRRQFIQTSSLMTLPILLRGMEVSAISKSSLSSIVGNENDRVLVLVQLNGGNDGLSTVIPLDQYEDLSKVRPKLIIPESNLLEIDGDRAFHPQMQGFQQMYEDERLGIVQGVGYPDQNRSHFRSTDIWHSASDSDEVLTTGWLGRHFELGAPGYPDGYPNDECKDPFAMTLGFVLSETCQGTTSNYSFAVSNPDELISLDETVAGTVDNSCYGNELTFVKEIIRQTNAYSDTVTNAYEKGTNLVAYPEGNTLADQLKVVANLISGGLQTKVYVVSLGGFDLHANQIENDKPLEGVQATLLGQVSEAIAAFQADLDQLGVSEKVMGMTYSEFGRRIKENGSNGTDHGSAAPLFVFGDCVKGGTLGANAEIDKDVDPLEGVAMQYDFRSIYATLLIDWFQVDESDVRRVLFDDFTVLPILRDCSVPSSTEENTNISLTSYPNPTSDVAYVELESTGDSIRVEVYDVRGARLAIVLDKKLPSGKHKIPVDMRRFSAGTYIIRVMQGSRVATHRQVKL